MNRTNFQRLLITASCVAVGLVPSMWNGFPLLYSDTSTYLASGFEFETPFDRPITYGLLLRLFSLNGLSLVLVPVCQCLVFLFSLKRLSESLQEKAAPLMLPILFGVSVSATSYAWCLNILLPDFLTPVAYIILFVLLVNSRISIIDYIVFGISISAHISNIFLFCFVLLVVLVLRRRLMAIGLSGFDWNRILVLFAIMGAALIISGSAISKSGPIFLAGNLAEKGILQKTLDKKCAEEDWTLCSMKDSIPTSFDYFVWNEHSPLYRLGGWKTLRSELKEVNKAAFSSSSLLYDNFATTSRLIVEQLIKINVAEGTGSFDTTTLLMKRIGQYTVADREAALHSLQAQGTLRHLISLRSMVQIGTAFTACGFFVLLIWYWSKISLPIRLFAVGSVIVIFANAVLIASVSEVANRHGLKIMVLLPLNLMLILFDRIKVRKAKLV